MKITVKNGSASLTIDPGTHIDNNDKAVIMRGISKILNMNQTHSSKKTVRPKTKVRK